MAMDIYRFPMSYGVVTDGGKRFLGLVNSDGESAFVLYDLEENDIIHKFQYMDTRNWRLNKQLEDHPTGVSDKGAYFVSDYLLSEEQGESFCKPCGMEVRAYDKEGGRLCATIPVSEGYKEWPLNCRLLDMAKLEDGFYLVIFSEKMRSERDFVVALYDGQSGESGELWRSTGHQMRYFDVAYHPETRIITVKKAEEFFYDVFDKNEYDLYTLQLSEDYGEITLLSEEKITRVESESNPLPGLTSQKQKRGLLRGKLHRYVDDASGQVLLEMKEGMNTVCEYIAIPGLNSLVLEGSGVMGGGATYYVIVGTDSGYELAETIEMNSAARIRYDEEEGWIALVGAEESVVLRHKA